MNDTPEIKSKPPNQDLVEKEYNQPPFLFLPGLFGGGDALTELREEILERIGREGVFFPSSISTRERAGFFDNNVNEWIKLADKTRSGMIVAHSLGTAELKYLLQWMEKQEKIPPNLKIVLVSPLGASETSRGLRVVPTVVDIHKNVAFYDQHTAYPLPDSFYEGSDDIEPSRAERREQFLNLFGDRLVEYKGEKMPLKGALETIDRALKESRGSEIRNRLFKERSALLAPFIQELYEGRYIPDERHREMKERFDADISRLGLLIQGLRFLPQILRTIFSSTNVIKRLAAAASGAQIHLVVLENDLFLPFDQAERLVQQMRKEDINIYLHKLPVYAHSSFAYQPREFVEKLKEISDKDEKETS